ncbi:CPBP family intramembrane glutamic endopeptidase [Psychroflexus sp. MBR-150]|jgi:membrane protease YdiL (CAAX protease family)
MKGFIEQAYKGYTDWWRYLVGFFIIFIIWQLGSTIQVFFVFLKLLNDGLSADEILMKLSDVSVLMGTLESNFNFFLLLLGFVFGFAGIILVIKLLHHLKLKQLITSREKIDWNRIGLSFGVIAVLISGSILLDYQLSPEDYQYNFELNRFLILALIGITMVPIQTTFEELLFRGYLLQGFGSVFKSRAVALILTSVLFGGLHIANPEVAKLGYQTLIVYIGTGFFLGIMTLMDEGLELSIGFHAGNNLLTALLLTADWTAFQTHSVFRYLGEPSLVSDVYIPVLVFYPALILMYSKIYKWKNWKQKLFGKVKYEPSSEV